MIPMSLESILDGILEEDLSISSVDQSESPASLPSSPPPLLSLIGDVLPPTTVVSSTFMQSPSTSISGTDSPDFPSSLMSGSNGISLMVAEGIEADTGPSVPCISIKSEIPDSCTTIGMMLEYADSNSNDDSNASLRKTESPLTPATPDRQPDCSTTVQGSLDDSRDDEPKRMCLVCGDVASGFHYGVSSCEACKAFFKRTIQGGVDYTCPASNDCEINKRRRKACQACRYKKCLKMGMLKEGVRLDRVRGGRQKYRNRFRHYPTCEGMLMDRAPISLEENKIFSALKRHEPERMLPLLSSDISVAAKTPNLLRLITDSQNSNSLKRPLKDTVEDRLQKIAAFYGRELVSTITWAKKVPGFTDLILEDQMSLLQGSWSEIATLTIAYQTLNAKDKEQVVGVKSEVDTGCSSYPLLSKKLKLGEDHDQEHSAQSDRKLQLASDFSLNQQEALECDLTELYNHSMQIVGRAESLGLREEEYIMLKAVLLCNCSVNIREQKAYSGLRDSVLDSFQNCVAVIRSPNKNSTLSVQHLLLLLPFVRQADVCVRKFLKQVRSQGLVNMNKLMVEMLEP